MVNAASLLKVDPKYAALSSTITAAMDTLAKLTDEPSPATSGYECFPEFRGPGIGVFGSFSNG
jgi:hypothetical protein